MESSTAEPTDISRNLSRSEDTLLFPAAFPCFSSFSCLLLFPAALISEMGRPRWTTPEQLAFLESFLHLLPQVKGSTGLTTLYSQVYDAFLQKWDPAPLKPDPKLSPEALEAAAKTRLRSVSLFFDSLCSCTHGPLAHRLLVWTRATGRHEGAAVLETSTSRPRLIRQVTA